MNLINIIFIILYLYYLLIIKTKELYGYINDYEKIKDKSFLFFIKYVSTRMALFYILAYFYFYISNHFDYLLFEKGSKIINDIKIYLLIYLVNLTLVIFKGYKEYFSK
jgi:hypothetical protein